MSYLLDGTIIRRPNSMEEGNSTQYAQVRPLGGVNRRDYFGANKRIWTFMYKNVNLTDYGVINTIYQSYLTNGSAKTFQSTEPNYTVAQTTVHVDLTVRQFTMPGSSYISDFVLILTEA